MGAVAGKMMRGWRRLIGRWWFWLIAFLALAVCTIITIHGMGELAWLHEQEAARAAGDGTAFSDLVSKAPEVDDARQQQLWQWMQAVEAHTWHWRLQTNESTWFAEQIVHSGSTAIRFSKSESHDRDQDVDILNHLLDSGDLVLCSGGWLRHDFPHPECVNLVDASHVRIPDVAALIAISNWYCHTAANGDLRSLDRLDQLLHATDMASSLVDGMYRCAVEERRDIAYLALLAARALPVERIAAWLNEPDRMPRIAASSLRGERLQGIAILGQQGYLHALNSNPMLTASAMPLTASIDYLLLARMCATWSKRMRSIADAFDEGARAPDIWQWPTKTQDWTSRHSFSRQVIPNLCEWSLTCIEAINRHRMARAMGRLVLDWQAGHLPADAEAARSDLVAAANPTSLLPPLQYERLSPSRVRIGLDPHGPLPAFVPVNRFSSDDPRAKPGQFTSICLPADKRAFVLRNWSMEFDFSEAGPAATAKTAASPSER